MKYYEINFETFYRHGEFENWSKCADWAEENCDGEDFTIEEFESEEEYLQEIDNR